MRLAWMMALTGVLLAPRVAPAFWPDGEGDVDPGDYNAAVVQTDTVAARVIAAVAKLEPQMGKQLRALWESARMGHEELAITGAHVSGDPQKRVQCAVKGQFVHVPSQWGRAFSWWAETQETNHVKHRFPFARDGIHGTDRIIQQVFSDPRQGAGEIAIEQCRRKTTPSGAEERMAMADGMGPRMICEIEHNAQMARSVRARHTRNAATLDILHVLEPTESHGSAQLLSWRHFSYRVETFGPLFRLTEASSWGPREIGDGRGGPQQGSYVHAKTTVGLRLPLRSLRVETNHTYESSPVMSPRALVPFGRRNY